MVVNKQVKANCLNWTSSSPFGNIVVQFCNMASLKGTILERGNAGQPTTVGNVWWTRLSDEQSCDNQYHLICLMGMLVRAIVFASLFKNIGCDCCKYCFMVHCLERNYDDNHDAVNDFDNGYNDDYENIKLSVAFWSHYINNSIVVNCTNTFNNSDNNNVVGRCDNQKLYWFTTTIDLTRPIVNNHIGNNTNNNEFTSTLLDGNIDHVERNE
jgi:hypothetical protein